MQGVGYVRDHQLVVRLNNAVLLPFNDESTINIGTPIVTGRLVPLAEDLSVRDPARPPTEKEKRLFRLESGVIAGRVLPGEVLATVGTYLQSTGVRLCASKGFAFVHGTICAASDIPRQGKPPFDPSKARDALSGALGFVAIPRRRFVRLRCRQREHGLRVRRRCGVRLPVTFGGSGISRTAANAG